jgi:hypothetical protein
MSVPLEVSGGPPLECLPGQLNVITGCGSQILDKASELLEFIERGHFSELDCTHLLSMMSTSLQKGSN